jgi:hypothetical protein
MRAPPPPQREPVTGWLSNGWLRAEDGVLAAWSFSLPAVSSLFGTVGPMASESGPHPLTGAIELLAVAGAFAALLTRPPQQPSVRLAGSDAPRWIICGPLIGGLAFATDGAMTQLGLGSGDWVIGLAFVAIMIGTLGANHLPVVSAPLRRLFVVPFTLVSAAYFNGFAAIFLGSLDIGQVLATAPAAGLSFGLFILLLIFGGMAAYYAMFVVAPRELADPEASGMRWAVRFALFVVASLAGIGWLAVIAG